MLPQRALLQARQPGGRSSSSGRVVQCAAQAERLAAPSAAANRVRLGSSDLLVSGGSVAQHTQSGGPAPVLQPSRPPAHERRVAGYAESGEPATTGAAPAGS